MVFSRTEDQNMLQMLCKICIFTLRNLNPEHSTVILFLIFITVKYS